MTAQQYVVRAAQQLKLDLIKPTRGNPGILAMDYASGSGKCVVDALKWDDAKTQINAYAQKRAA